MGQQPYNRKNHLLLAFNFCNFTLWIPPVLNARSRRPVRPRPCTPLLLGNCVGLGLEVWVRKSKIIEVFEGKSKTIKRGHCSSPRGFTVIAPAHVYYDLKGNFFVVEVKHLLLFWIRVAVPDWSAGRATMTGV